MLQKYNIFIKLLAIIIVFGSIFFALQFLIEFSLGMEQPLLKIGLALVESLLLVFSTFFFFQAFKYFRLPNFFYQKRVYEKDFFFTAIGVSIYRNVLVNSFLRHANPRVYLTGRKREYIHIFIEETKQSETSHFLALLFTWAIQLYYIAHLEFVLFFSLTLFTILFNFYPIQLQRKNRFIFEGKIASRDNEIE